MNKINKIPLSSPSFFGKEKMLLSDCIKTGWITTSGKYLDLFKKNIQKITKQKKVVLLINGTSALQLSIRCLDPKPGDEVIVPSITFISTVNSIKYNNCSPIFMDCDDNYLIDLKKTEEFLKKNTFKKNGFSINKKTKKKILAIIVVHTFGNCVNLNKEIVLMFKKYNIKIIEDAAESFGSYLKENGRLRHSGTMGDIGCFSFNGNKVFTTGGGGAVITKNEKYYKKINYLSKQAKDDKINFIHNDVGYNFFMSNLHAAVGCSQIRHLKKIISKKEKIHKIYTKYLSSIPGVRILEENQNTISNFWLNILEIDGKVFGRTKSKIIKYMLSKGVEVRSLWCPNHLQKPYKKYEAFKIKKSNELFKKSICLPSSYSLTKKQTMFVINILKNYGKKN